MGEEEALPEQVLSLSSEKKRDNKYKTQNRRQNKGSCLMHGINHCPV